MTQATIKLPPKLVPVFSGVARYRGAYGGRGSAKTRNFAKMAAVRGYQLAMEGKSGHIVCGRQFQNSISDSSFSEIASAIASEPWLEAFYDVGKNYIRTRCGRISFLFRGLQHNLDSLKSISNIYLVWIDEAENVSEYAWQKLLPTVREEGSEVWVTWNPESDESATHERFRKDPPTDSKIVQLNWRDNPWWNSALEAERKDDQLKRPESYDWIWEGDFNRNQVGSIYANYLIKAEEEGRITTAGYQPGVPVFTAWDLGKSDATSIWFAQIVGFQVRVIDFYEANQEDLEHYARLLRSKPYEYSKHYLPHDSKHERLGMKGSIKDQIQQMGFKCEALGANGISAGIELARNMLKTCYIDKDKCKDGIKSLRNHKYEYDEKRKTFSTKPLHDWTSHASDAFRYLAYAVEDQQTQDIVPEEIDISTFGGSDGWMG